MSSDKNGYILERRGTVTNAHGAEAGVWVIAETHDIQTRCAKVVVTDEAGRYLIPELPQAKYSVWERIARLTYRDSHIV